MNHVSLNCNNFFDKYYIHPLSDDLSTRDKVIACIVTAVLFVLTAGLFHLINYVYHCIKERNIQPQPITDGSPNPFSAVAAGHNTFSPAVLESEEESVDATSEPEEETLSLTQLFNQEKLPAADLATFCAYPLHYAAQHSLLPLAKKLIEQVGSDIFAKNGKGMTAYQLTDSVEIKRLLIQKANVRTPSSDNLAIIPSTIHSEKYSVLKQLGFDFNVQDAKEGTPLHYLVLLDFNADNVRALLALGADPTVRDRSDRTPFNCACPAIRKVIIEHFMDNWEIARSNDAFVGNPFHWAVTNDRPELIAPLAQLGVDVNTHDRHNETPLDIACSYPNIQCVIELIRGGGEY